MDSQWTVLEVLPERKLKAKCSCGFIGIRAAKDINALKSKRCLDCFRKSCIARFKTYRQDTKGKANHNWRGTEHIPQDYFRQIRDGAVKRGLDFQITIENLQELWVKQKGLCSYTSRPLIFKMKRNSVKAPSYEIKNQYASLDRKDPAKGYLPDNIQWVWKPINLMKMAFTHEEFLNLVAEISNLS